MVTSCYATRARMGWGGLGVAVSQAQHFHQKKAKPFVDEITELIYVLVLTTPVCFRCIHTFINTFIRGPNKLTYAQKRRQMPCFLTCGKVSIIKVRDFSSDNYLSATLSYTNTGNGKQLVLLTQITRAG